jgi:ribonuclease BN (tRNA processing enzyme)
VRLTVVGSGPARPQPDTPASGLLVETAGAAILLDCGPGVISRLARTHDPGRLSAVFIGHLHADHYLDLAPLRYLFPWEGAEGKTMRVLLPPGGRAHMAALAGAISERETFFDEAFELEEYDPQTGIRVGDAQLSIVPGRHYVPAWGVAIRDAAGARLVYAGDTGPNDGVVAAATGADMLICEATLRSVTEDEPQRGHLTADEALDHAARAGVGAVLLTHYASDRRDALEALAARSRVPAAVARPGLAAEVVAGAPVDVRTPSADPTPRPEPTPSFVPLVGSS